MIANDPLWLAMLNHLFKPTRSLPALIGALLLAGVLKHPEEAAHIIARAITDAEAPAPEGANVNPRTP